MTPVAEMLSYAFMRRALMAGLATGLLCSVISVFVFLRRLAFATSGIAHAAFGGVAVGLYTGGPPALAAGLFAVLVAWIIGYLSRRGEVDHQNTTGIISAAAMALGIVLVGLSRSYVPDLFSYLFGNILAVGPSDLRALLAIGFPVLVVLGLCLRPLISVAFDRDAAEAGGLPVAWLDYILLTALAVTVVLAVRVLGIVLASALLITPAATAYQLAANYRGMLVLSTVTGVTSAVVGLVLSYQWGLASGATIALCATALYVAAVMASPRRRRTRWVAPAAARKTVGPGAVTGTGTGAAAGSTAGPGSSSKTGRETGHLGG